MSKNKHLGEVVKAYIDTILWIEGIDHAETTGSFDLRALEDCREFLNEIKHLEHDLDSRRLGILLASYPKEHRSKEFSFARIIERELRNRE